MAHRGKPPAPGVKVGAWRFDNVPQEATRTGWLAGPCHGLVCHTSRATKPCFKLLLGGDALCDGCAKGWKAEYFGYVPVRRDDGKPLVLGIHEAQFWALDTIPLGARIVWGRNKGEAEAVWVKQGPDKPTWRTYYPNEWPRHNITDYLALKLWKRPDIIPALTELWSEECQRAVTDDLPATIHPVEVPPAVEEPVNRVQNAVPAGPALDDTLKRLRAKQARLKLAETNGHPK